MKSIKILALCQLLTIFSLGYTMEKNIKEEKIMFWSEVQPSLRSESKMSIMAYDLCQYVQRDDIKNVQKLMEQGVDINFQDEPFNGNTALIYAARSGRVKIAQLLIESGADIGAKTRFKMGPLEGAIFESQNPEIVKMLLKLGADIFTKNYQNKNAIELAKEKNNQEIINIINAELNKFKDALFKAISNLEYDNVKLLLKRMPIGIYDSEKNNLLHIALKPALKELTDKEKAIKENIIKLIIDAMAILRILDKHLIEKNKACQTPFDLLVINKLNHEILRHILFYKNN